MSNNVPINRTRAVDEQHINKAFNNTNQLSVMQMDSMFKHTVCYYLSLQFNNNTILIK